MVGIDSESYTARDIPEGNIIRELLKYVSDSGVISFGGGSPDEKFVPRDEIRRVWSILSAGPKKYDGSLSIIKEPNQLKGTLGYGSTIGRTELRELLADSFKEQGATKGNVIVTVGAQEAIKLINHTLCNPKDVAVFVAPSYLAAIAIAKCRSLDSRMVSYENPIDGLEGLIDKLDGGKKHIKYVYVVPDFNNPTGETMGLKDRQALFDLAAEHSFLIVEDSPYRKIRFSGEPIPTIKSLDKDNEFVLHLGSASKDITPELRVGWAIGNKMLIDNMVKGKQCTTACTAQIPQLVAAEMYASGFVDKWVKDVAIPAYRRKKEHMVKAIDETMPDAEHTDPDGGFFVWLELPGDVDTYQILNSKVLKPLDNGKPVDEHYKVIFVPGKFTVPEKYAKRYRNTARLNFSLPEEDIIRCGVDRLAYLLGQH